ncbi:MAG: DUF2071 domain-containing protein, partial [Planctomycetes bacterium]|nr:DUF2071 domain-containing protein [Planctomycetota bacterium]
HETNVRTYVHLDGREPGVWFISLDAASSLAVRVARRCWHFPYYRSRMDVSRSENRIRYSGKRLWPGEPGPGYSIEATIGSEWRGSDGERKTNHAVPGTFEHFLAERYVMYAEKRDGTLLRGRVHHPPYPLRQVEIGKMEQSLLTACGIEASGEPTHALFSDGVDVEVFGMEPV